MTWDLHTSYRPQSSGRVERTNYTIKLQLSKICQETSMVWIQALPLALLRIRIQPKGKYRLSPYELMYGRPYQSPGLPGELKVKGEQNVFNYLISLGKVLHELKGYVVLNKSLSLDSPAHPFQPGDWVYLKSWTEEPLQEKWKGPFQVLLTTYTAVKLDKKGPWIHYSRIKKAPTLWTAEQQAPLKLKLKRL